MGIFHVRSQSGKTNEIPIELGDTMSRFCTATPEEVSQPTHPVLSGTISCSVRESPHDPWKEAKFEYGLQGWAKVYVLGEPATHYVEDDNLFDNFSWIPIYAIHTIPIGGSAKGCFCWAIQD